MRIYANEKVTNPLKKWHNCFNFGTVLMTSKSPFNIQELRDGNIDKFVQSIMSESTPIPVPAAARLTISGFGRTRESAFMTLARLVRNFDELGSHPRPVYKTLVLIVACLQGEYRHNFIPIARELAPEIQTVQYLTFEELYTPLRDEIHLMAGAIYEFLMFDTPLPEHDDFSHTARRCCAPPEPEDSEFDGVIFTNPNAQPAPEPANPEEDEELDFDPLAGRKNKRKEAVETLIDFEAFEEVQAASSLPQPGPTFHIGSPEPVQVVVKSPSPPPPQDSVGDEEIRVGTVDDFLMIPGFVLVTKYQCDNAIESC
jgi:hypothetical protein